MIFKIGKRTVFSQLPDIPDDILEEEDALTRLKNVEQKLNHVWSRWSKEYLIGLKRNSTKTKFPNPESNMISDQEILFSLRTKEHIEGCGRKRRF